MLNAQSSKLKLLSRVGRLLPGVLSSLVVAAVTAPVLAQQPGGGGQPTTLSSLGCGPDEIARVNADDEWECSSALTDLENRFISFAVVDSTGSQVGSTITVSGNFVGIAIVLLDVGSDRRSMITLTKAGIANGASVFFESTDCTGAAWIRPSFGFDPAITPSAMVPDGDARRLYVATGSPSVAVQTQSRLESFGGGEPATCSSSSFSGELLPAELVDFDLHATFPPPYELVIQ